MATEHNSQARKPHVPLKRTNYEATLAKTQKMASELMAEMNDEHPPMLILLRFKDGQDEDVGGDVFMVSAMMQHQIGKEALMELVGQALQSRKYQMAVLVAEAWTVETKIDKPEDEKPIDLNKLPKASEHPDRAEVLMINMYSLDEQYTIAHPIVTKDGKRGFERKTLDDAFEERKEEGTSFLGGTLSLQ